MWRKGRRLFSAAAVLMILTAAAHTAGTIAPRQPDPKDTAVLYAMDAYKLPLGMGMTPSMLDIYFDLALTMSITFTALGVMSLVLAASAEVSGRVLKRVALVNVVWGAAFVILNCAYRVPPPLICGAVIEAAAIGSLFTVARDGA